MHHVLVIDDDSSVRFAIRLLLEYLKFGVEEAQDGREGLEKAQRNPPDLILCDLDMPIMDGFETLAQLRDDPVLGTVPVIIVSALLDDDNHRRVMRGGASAALSKPFAFDGLVSMIQVHLAPSS